MKDGSNADSVYITGAYRVASYDPTLLPLLAGSDQDPPGRFDDPRREFRVRYVADSLRGCLVESVAQWRPSASSVVEFAKAVARTDRDIEPAWHTPIIPQAWLEKQRKVRLRAAKHSGIFDLPSNIATLATSVAVAREVTDQLGGDYVLDEAATMLAGRRGRRISQAISAEVYRRDPQPDGLSFRSRFDITERCWAMFDHVDIEWLSSPECLDKECPEDYRAAEGAANHHGLALPATWRN